MLFFHVVITEAILSVFLIIFTGEMAFRITANTANTVNIVQSGAD
ncbi:MAG: hypothetical protein RLY17_1029 [Pseudomonadota bacterium]|jgi:hypothetical protein